MDIKLVIVLRKKQKNSKEKDKNNNNNNNNNINKYENILYNEITFEDEETNLFDFSKTFSQYFNKNKLRR
jgi:hypothetical protein